MWFICNILNLVQKLYKVFLVAKSMKVCISTGSNVVNQDGTVTFPCPTCNEQITRSGFARTNQLKYTCKCGYVGP